MKIITELQGIGEGELVSTLFTKLGLPLYVPDAILNST